MTDDTKKWLDYTNRELVKQAEFILKMIEDSYSVGQIEKVVKGVLEYHRDEISS